MWLEILTNKFTGHISKEQFNTLPDSLRQRIQQLSFRIIERDTYLSISFRSAEAAENLQSEIKKYERNLERAERRRSTENWASGGRYEATDIEEIFDIQEGKCYYTGQPISRRGKNYSIDHITPVYSGGSSWPSNLALVLKQVNQEKHDLSQRAYWKLLEKHNGTEWVQKRKAVCRKIDFTRRKIDKKRRLAVKAQVLKLSRQLGELFSNVNISLSLERDILTLEIEYIEVRFPKGFIRNKKRFQNHEYFESVIRQLLGS